jgi:hypothetical protein
MDYVLDPCARHLSKITEQLSHPSIHHIKSHLEIHPNLIAVLSSIVDEPWAVYLLSTSCVWVPILAFYIYLGFFLLFVALTSFSLYPRWCSMKTWSFTYIELGNYHSISQFWEIRMFVCLYEFWKHVTHPQFVKSFVITLFKSILEFHQSFQDNTFMWEFPSSQNTKLFFWILPCNFV